MADDLGIVLSAPIVESDIKLNVTGLKELKEAQAILDKLAKGASKDAKEVEKSVRDMFSGVGNPEGLDNILKSINEIQTAIEGIRTSIDPVMSKLASGDFSSLQIVVDKLEEVRSIAESLNGKQFGITNVTQMIADGLSPEAAKNNALKQYRDDAIAFEMEVQRVAVTLSQVLNSGVLKGTEAGALASSGIGNFFKFDPSAWERAVSKSGVEKIGDRLSELLPIVNAFNAAMSSMDSDVLNANGLSELKLPEYNLQEFSAAKNEANDIYELINRIIAKLDELSESASKIASSLGDDTALNKISTLIDHIKSSFDEMANSAREAFANIGSAVSATGSSSAESAIDDITQDNEELTESAKAAESAVRAEADAVGALARVVHQETTASGKGTKVSDTSVTKYEDFRTREITTTEYDGKSTTRIKETINLEKQHAAALKNTASAAKQAALSNADYSNILSKIDKSIEASTIIDTPEIEDAREALKGYRNEITHLLESFRSGKTTTEEFEKQFKAINSGIEASSKIIERGTLSGMLDRALNDIPNQLFNIGENVLSIQALATFMREATRASIELQASLADLQVVTRASDSEMMSYASSATRTASEIGVATNDLLTAAATYARLGYSLEESDALAKYTAMLQRVGDIEASDAQNAITAILAAFPDDAHIDNIESVMDRLVAVGNNFPISVSQLAEGMNNASSALAAAGNNFDESLALLMAANTTINFCRVA